MDALGYIIYAIVMIVCMVLTYLLQPSMSQQGQAPGEIDTATVDATSPVPVLFGTRRIDASNCVWYGDIGTTPIQSCNGKK